jgi:hypothetical protein
MSWRVLPFVAWYGKDEAEKVPHAEAFEICEYGRYQDKRELARFSPYFGDILVTDK